MAPFTHMVKPSSQHGYVITCPVKCGMEFFIRPHISTGVGWKYLSIPKLQRLHRWSLGLSIFMSIYISIGSKRYCIGTPGLYSLSEWPFRIREIGCYNYRTALTIDRQLDCAAAEGPVEFRSDYKSQTRISRLWDFTRSCGKTSVRLVNKGPELPE